MSLAERLIALEHEGWDALVAGEGGRHYREHLTEHALMASTTFVRDGEVWKVAFHQQSPKP